MEVQWISDTLQVMGSVKDNYSVKKWVLSFTGKKFIPQTDR
jgi:hypothetical protein